MKTFTAASIARWHGRRISRPAWWICGAALLSLAVSPAFAETEHVSGQSCESLAALTLPDTTITIAQTVSAGAQPGLPAFCRVAATLQPVPGSNIRIEMWMPVAADWNGRFLGTGNGAFGGAIRSDSLSNGLRLGYATVNTDQGTFPAATLPNAGYGAGIGHPEMVIDWGWRSTHLMTVIAKRIVNTFYGRTPKHSYFNGCSTGGHQALSEAERFPDDYDGILAGAPGHNRTQLHTYFLWTAILASHPDYAIPASKTPLINNAALAACAGKDGGLSTDGFLTDPRHCDFDPAVLQCTGADAPTCLTQGQVQGLKLAYQGPRNPRTGRLIYPGWERATGGSLNYPPNLREGPSRWFSYPLPSDPL
jgi:feruloyl esterase